MDIDCKYKKCTAYLYDYEPEFDIDFAWKIQNGLEENPQNYQLFIELADALHGTNVNQEYLCLEMAEFYSKQSNASIDTLDNVTRRMEEIVDSGELLVYPVSVIVISSENKTYNQGIREAEWCNDILLVNREIELKANTLFWLRMGLYEDRRVAATISRSEEDLFSPYEATVYSPYENRM